MRDDEFEWDDAKAEANVRKHKIDFADARRVFDDPLAVVEIDDSEDYGEDRFRITGRVESIVIVVIHTERAGRIRIISARKAEPHERRQYDRG